MGVRGLIRDVICVYVGFRLLWSGFSGISLAKNQLLVYGLIVFGFSLWFILERVGVLPKL